LTTEIAEVYVDVFHVDQAPDVFVSVYLVLAPDVKPGADRHYPDQSN
jgi:hypothetical protein